MAVTWVDTFCCALLCCCVYEHTVGRCERRLREQMEEEREMLESFSRRMETTINARLPPVTTAATVTVVATVAKQPSAPLGSSSSSK